MAMQWKTMSFCVVLLVSFGVATTVWADDPEFICGTGLLGGLDDLLVQVPGDNVVEARIVFVSFPDRPDSEKTLPNWAENMQTDLMAYIDAMSRGTQNLDLSVLRRPAPDSALAWVADTTASYYVTHGGFGTLNKEIMEEIAATFDGVWVGVEEVFMVHYQCTFSNCGIGGISCLCLPSGSMVPGFTEGAIQGGTTTRMYFTDSSSDSVSLNNSRNRENTKWIAGHEYGHRLGMNHSPPDVPPDNPSFVNMGRYDIMRKSASGVLHEGLVPYHPLQLSMDLTPGWLPPDSLIEMDMEGLRVHDVRGDSALLYEVVVPGSTQSFVLVNNQGRTSYDQKYLNTGLLIWHVLRNSAGTVRGWDLESAKGKQPNAVSGEDSLEANIDHNGSADDFFDGSPSVFGCNTNPHTYLYNPASYSSPQDTPTSVAFENIQPANDGTGDMLVDVYVTPKQRVVFPNGGEHVCSGGAGIWWAVRPSACATSVDIYLSADGGASYVPLALGEPNDGQYIWTPTADGDMYRIQIRSYDAANGVGVDASDANFSVAPCGGSSCPVVYQGEPGQMVAVNNVLSRSYQIGVRNAAERTTDLLMLPETPPGGDGRYHFELRENEIYYSVFDAVELQVFDAIEGTTVVTTVDGRTVAFQGEPLWASSVMAVEGIPEGTALSPDEGIHAMPGSVIEYEWADLPPSASAVVLMEPNFKIYPPCLCLPCDDCGPYFAPSGRPLNSGLLIEQWHDGGWQFVGDLVPRLDWERVAVELPASSGGILRIRVRWEGTHNFRMVGWVPEASELEPSYRLQPLHAEHSRLGGLGEALAAVDGIPALLTQGDVIFLGFDAPPLSEGTGRRLALRSFGRYSNSLEGLGALATTGIGSGSVPVPRETAITISGSNPFNPATAWKLDLANASLVDLRVYDTEGRLVRELVGDRLEAGVHTVRWDGTNEDGQVVPSGVYFWRFDGAGLRRADKFVVLR